MPRAYKRWEDHSPRWKREAKRDGVSPQRWNAWQKLAPTTRKDTDPRKYAQGKGIAEQRKERRISQATQRIRAIGGTKSRLSFIQYNVERMTDRDRDWTVKATEDQLRRKAGQKAISGYASNPWWYR